jgi:hypothetical protein
MPRRRHGRQSKSIGIKRLDHGIKKRGVAAAFFD